MVSGSNVISKSCDKIIKTLIQKFKMARHPQNRCIKAVNWLSYIYHTQGMLQVSFEKGRQRTDLKKWPILWICALWTGFSVWVLAGGDGRNEYREHHFYYHQGANSIQVYAVWAQKCRCYLPTFDGESSGWLKVENLFPLHQWYHHLLKDIRAAHSTSQHCFP